MIYVPDEFQDYKFLAYASDNYVFLTKAHHIFGSSGDPATIQGVYQYFSPSFYTFEGTYTSSEYEAFPDISENFSSSDFDRADFPVIFICGFIIFFLFAFVLNNLTRLVKKGGILFSSN